jgi:regulator of RNase E activity RraA
MPRGSEHEETDERMAVSDQLEPEWLEALRGVSTATISTRLFALGLRNPALAGLRLMSRGGEPMVGEAFTLRYIPAREDIDRLEVFQDPAHPQRRAIEVCPPGSVLVMDCRGEGRAASAGHILMTRLEVRGAAGFVTDGSLRDTPGIAGLAMPIYSAGASPMTNLAQHHAVDIDVPIGCAGVAVYPGDVMVGDAEGVVCVPRHLVGVVAGSAAEQEDLEAFLLERIRGGAALPGTYPADEATMRAYRTARGIDK